MFNNWRVITSTINIEDGENDIVERKATEKEAHDLYLNKLSSLGTNPSTKGLVIRLYNPNGNLAEEYYVDNTKYAPIEE